MEPNQHTWAHRRRSRLASELASDYSSTRKSTATTLSIHQSLPSPPISLALRAQTMPATTHRSPSGSFWLVLYFLLNLALTLYNKIVLIHFPFPYTLTALHALCGTVGTFVLLNWTPTTLSLKETIRGKKSSPIPRPNTTHDPLVPPIPSLRGRELVVLLLYSILYTVNILVSNASLQLVTVHFHQVVRASAPLFTVALSALLLGKYCSRAKLLSLVPVMAGVGLATYGDYYFTPEGFFLTLLGTLLAAMKTITTNLLQKPPTTEPYYPPLSPLSAPYVFPREKPKSPVNGNVQREPLLRAPEPSPTRSNLLTRNHTRLRSSSPISVNPNRWNRYRAAALSTLSLPKLSLTPLQLLYLLSPIAFVQTTMLAHFSGELQSVNLHLNRAATEYVSRAGVDDHWRGWGVDGSPRLWLVLNGVLAFFLNVVSFNANRTVGPLAMSVAANVKQVLAVLCSVTVFNLHVTEMNGSGILLTLVGGAWYAAVELREKKNEP